MDTTTEFLTAFYSQKFSSFEEFYSKLKDFEKHCNASAESKVRAYHNINIIDIRHSRGSCGSRISLSAMSGKLWITKYHMIHNHPPLPETAKIDQSVRRLQVQEPGKDELVISDDVQLVLDDIVDQLPNHNASLESMRGSPNKSQSASRPVLERKAAARDRLAARTKKARGLKLAPCLRRLAELASAGTGQEFHKHLDELEALVDIWKRGDNSSLVSGHSGSSSSVRTESHPVTPSPTDSLAIAKAVENLFRKQKALESSNVLTPLSAKGQVRSQNDPQILTPLVAANTVSVIQTPTQPVVLKQALGSQSGAFISGSGVVTVPSGGVATLSKDVVLADAGGGQLHLINSASIVSSTGQKNDNGVTDGQHILGYVIQPMPALSSGGQTLLPSTAVVAPTNFVPIAPKLPISDSPGQAFQPIPPPPPKAVRPPMPVCKPKVVKPRGRQPKGKSPLRESLIAPCDGLSVTPFEDDDSEPKPWTPMIMEGDSCSYFLFVEDANYYYSPEEDAWLPADQQTMAVDT
ncbi:unnamed protein product [Mesocestoides corti]|uniref:Uncharacterized protein n=1 Tax=Mesocestoides corti TaxID=53468 RepID=A0A0R3UE26_MESCO|nr:unnamed protein product [Mesocestoides corti]